LDQGRGRTLWWVIGLTVSAGAAMVLMGRGSEVLLGAVAPAAAAGGSWKAMARTWTERPEALLAVTMKAFAAKVVFFAGYVAAVLGVFDVRPLPFVISFTAAFLVTHLTEAWCLQRMLASGLAAGAGRGK
jgi:hypothetical protein